MRDRPAPGVTLLSQKMGIHEWAYDNEIDHDKRYVVPQARLEPHVLRKSKIEVELGFDPLTG